MSRLNTLMNVLVLAVIMASGGVFVSSRTSLPSLSPPDDAWFQAQVIESPTPVLVKFGADWCGPCRRLDPELDQLGLNGKLAIVRVDVGKHQRLAQHYGVSGIPHLLLFQHGVVVAQRVGYADHEQLRQWVSGHAK